MSAPRAAGFMLSMLAAGLTLSGCGSPVAGGGQVAEGGIGGSGSGTATQYGSIIVSGFRHFPVADDALVRLDGQPIDPRSVNAIGKGLPLGITLEYLLADDAASDLSSGTAIAIDAWHQVIGPVTSTAPLKVLGQPLFSTSDTLLENLPGEVSDLQPGDIVAVGGLRTAGDSIRAGRIALLPTATPDWQIVGQLSDVTSAQVAIGGQQVSLDGVELVDCPQPLAAGQQAAIRASRSDTFVAGDVLTSAYRLTCLRDGLGLFANPPFAANVPETLPAAVEGIVSDFDLATLTMVIDGQTVDISQLTDLTEELLAHLLLGVRSEVVGTINTSSGVLLAERITVLDPLLSAVAPINAINENLISLLGIDAVALPDIADPVALLQTGLPFQGSLRGFIDDNAQLFIGAIDNVGSSDNSNISLVGPITSIDSLAGTFSVAEVPFDASSADNLLVDTIDGTISIIESGLCLPLPLLPCPVSNNELFLSGLTPGQRADMSSAAFDGNMLTGGDVLISP